MYIGIQILYEKCSIVNIPNRYILYSYYFILWYFCFAVLTSLILCLLSSLPYLVVFKIWNFVNVLTLVYPFRNLWSLNVAIFLTKKSIISGSLETKTSIYNLLIAVYRYTNTFSCGLCVLLMILYYIFIRWFKLMKRCCHFMYLKYLNTAFKIHQVNCIVIILYYEVRF